LVTTKLSAVVKFVDEIGSGSKPETLGTNTTAVAFKPKTLVAASVMLFDPLFGPA
jgi:hypothetical protein